MSKYNRLSKLKLCVAAITLSGLSAEQEIAGKNNENINQEEWHTDHSFTLGFAIPIVNESWV